MRRKVIFLILYFSIMSFVYSNYKMKDNTIFFNDIAVYRKNHFGVMVPADIKSFKIINDRYAKDRYTVYFMGEEIRDNLNHKTTIIQRLKIIRLMWLNERREK